MSQPNDIFNDLLRRAGAGDADAIREIVLSYEPEVRRTARVLLGPALRPLLDPVDLMQSIHRSVLLHLRRGDFAVTTPNHLVALTLTMVRRRIARHWRRMRRQVRPNDIAAEDHAPFEATQPTPEAEDPARIAAIGDQVQHLLSRLPEVDRQLIELRLLGHSTVEAARAMHMDADVLRVRLSRLRTRLRAAGDADSWL